MQLSSIGSDEDARVFVLAATNRLEDLDPALLRRFDRRLQVTCLVCDISWSTLSAAVLFQAQTSLQRHDARHAGCCFSIAMARARGRCCFCFICHPVHTRTLHQL